MVLVLKLVRMQFHDRTLSWYRNKAWVESEVICAYILHKLITYTQYGCDKLWPQSRNAHVKTYISAMLRYFIQGHGFTDFMPRTFRCYPSCQIRYFCILTLRSSSNLSMTFLLGLQCSGNHEFSYQLPNTFKRWIYFIFPFISMILWFLAHTWHEYLIRYGGAVHGNHEGRPSHHVHNLRFKLIRT